MITCLTSTRCAELSTPSLGITRLPRHRVFHPSTPFNSLSRDHMVVREGPETPWFLDFQLPLSGSLRLIPDSHLYGPHNFQLPLSGSHDGARSKSRCGSPFNSLSRDHELRNPVSPILALDNELSTPSLGITFRWVAKEDACEKCTFNSLSRDHFTRVQVRLVNGDTIDFQLPLSGSRNR